MAKFYVSRFRLSDSQGLLKVFPDGDIQTVEFDINNMIDILQGQSFETRSTTGYIAGNIELTFDLNVFIRVQEVFQDLSQNWDYSTEISASFESAVVDSFQNFTPFRFVTFNDVVPQNQSLSAPAAASASTVQYRFRARSYNVSTTT